MAGLLDYGIDPMAMGLLGAGGALLTPTARGGGIGAALQAFPAGMMQGQEMQRRLQSDAQRQQALQQEMQMRQSELGMRQEAFGFKRDQYAAEQAAAQQKQDFHRKFIEYAAQKDPEIALLAGVDIKAAVERAFPKPEWKTFFSPEGRQTQGFVTPGRAPEQVGGAERKVQAINLGDRVVFGDPIDQTGPMMMGQSPESRASVAATLRGQNMADARARELAAATREAGNAGRAPSGYRQNPDGSLAFIPGGPADPATKADKTPNEQQSKDYLFASRADAANKIVAGLGNSPSVIGVANKQNLERLPLIGGALGSGVNAALSDSSQQYEQAKRDFINAVLRKESGAVIADTEFANADKQYFPQPFDSAAVKKQKAENRQRAVEGIALGAGPLRSGLSAASPAGRSAESDPLGLRR